MLPAERRLGMGPVPFVLVPVFQELIAYFGGASMQVKELRGCEDHGIEARGECEPWSRPVPGYEVHDG
ncbi:hypothetical protein GCM10007170_44350 [Arthrobacter liuii]|uniref:Uncharacterized protein n=1 Tax=Arthrobacter liuii TaxID=1476996 RepID=A0ABQ2AYN5_9MICC|nr:hypothetical protein GCM10007170_44350 [Arthrobacter liuii]